MVHILRKEILKYLNQFISARQKNASLYQEHLADHCYDQIVLPRICSGNHCYNQFVIKVRNQKRDLLREYLKEKGIMTEIYYPVPLHMQECFASLGGKLGDFVESEKASLETLALPIFSELKSDEIQYVASQIRSFMSAKK